MTILHGALRRGLWLVLLAALLLCAGRAAVAAVYYADVIDGGYNGCRIQNANGVVYIHFSIKFKAANGNTAGQRLYSRGIAVFGYDETGKQVSPLGYVNAAINGENAGYGELGSNYYIIYASINYPKPPWMNASEYTANVTVTMSPEAFQKWPAVGVQAANMTYNRDPVFAKIGALYIGPGTQGCQAIDPAKPPPSPVTTEIKVTAPDWDLGELERGKETTRTFVTDAQRLCFAYDAKYIEYDKYLISVSNRNGVTDNKFLLVNAADGSETVPYTLSFTGGGAPMALPSINGLPLTLGKSGRTCLTPTFKAWTDAKIKGGDFSDALTFTITTHS